MKKVLLVLVLVTCMAGFAFADHPGSSWGIGAILSHHDLATKGSGSDLGLSLIIPSSPIFWAIYTNGSLDYVTVTGDKLFVEGVVVSEINLHYYVGLGGFVSVWLDNFEYSSLGARVPIGLSWHALDFLEVFLGIVPTLGIQPGGEGDFFNFRWAPIEWGVRVWL